MADDHCTAIINSSCPPSKTRSGSSARSSLGENAELAKNDAYFSRTLLATGKKYFEASFFVKKIALYEKTLHDYIILHTSEPLTQERYAAIEDCWHELLKRVNLLRGFHITDYPPNKYALKKVVIYFSR